MDDDDATVEHQIRCHVVAIPYPGRGHVNPMMNFCKLLADRRPNFLFTFVVTEEWLGIIGSEPKPGNIRFGSVPNVIPSERDRAADFPGFIEATLTRLEEPVERLLERLEEPAGLIVHDTHLTWVVGMGNRRNVPVASFFTMPATVFSWFFHYDLLARRGHLRVDLSGRGEELVDYVPGIPPTRAADLPTPFTGKGHEVLGLVLSAFSSVAEAQYLLFTSVYELESQVIDAVKRELSIPVYAIGPAIPYSKATEGWVPDEDDRIVPDYVAWLDKQPTASVVYISQGSFLSVSDAQLEELVAGIRDSGVRYFWVARGEAGRFVSEDGDRGLIVPWCDQLRVLCHHAIGGFWSHCGWNSTKESAFAGVPILAFPIFWDQVPNGKMVEEDWGTGTRVKREEGAVVKREKIAELLKGFMDLGSDERKAMEKRVEEIRGICRQSIAKGGSAETDVEAFIRDISSYHRR